MGVVFGALKGRAHVAMAMRDGLIKKTARRQRFLVGEKKRVSGTENDPEIVGVSRDVDVWQGHALCVAGVVVDEGGLRSSQRSLEPPSSMRTRPPASRCAL